MTNRARGVDVDNRILRAQLGRDRRENHGLEDVGAQPLVDDARIVLGGGRRRW